jgi:transposase InsO family protein
MTTQCRELIEAEKHAGGNVAKACDLLEVSRSAFYEWHAHVPTARSVSDAELTEKIRYVHAASKGTYGAPRVHKELADQGVHVGKKRVARLMVGAGLAGRCRRRTRRTTVADPETKAMNLLARTFGPAGLALDTIWAGDITYVRTWEGWAYLATVIDLASRRVVGWAIANHMESSLVCEAMRMALLVRRPGPGLMFHSDRGSQYTSDDFRQLLKEHHITQSLSRPGQCWDNSVSESWFSTYKLELVEGRSWPTIAKLKAETLLWVEGWYNRRRRHSGLNYLSPVDYERQLLNNAATQAA